MQPASSPASAHAPQASPRAAVDGDDHGHGDEVAKDNKATSDNTDERSDNVQPPAAAADTQGSKTEAADPGSSQPGGQMSAVGESDAPSADTTTTATPADAAGQAVVAPPSERRRLDPKRTQVCLVPVLVLCSTCCANARTTNLIVGVPTHAAHAFASLTSHRIAP
jgi:hypothetical protein